MSSRSRVRYGEMRGIVTCCPASSAGVVTRRARISIGDGVVSRSSRMIAVDVAGVDAGGAAALRCTRTGAVS